MKLKILYEDKYILATEKPPKIPAQSDKTNDEDMVNILRKYMLTKNSNNENHYIGLIHRLDRPVGGVMVFAKNKFANRELSEQIRLKKIKKEYSTVVCGRPEKTEDIVENYLKKLKTINMSKVVPENSNNAKKSLLKYELIDSKETEKDGILSLLKIKLMTGRHHQIRVQLSNINLPIWGDNKYNKKFVKKKEWTQIALWATKITFYHPKTKKEITVVSKYHNEYPFSVFD